MWEQRGQWDFWNGDKVVELRRSFVEYRPVETHQHFVLPYERRNARWIVALDRDLREWDWIAERSRPVEDALREEIYAQMRDAVAVGETRLEILTVRPPRAPFDPIASLESVSDYLFAVSSTLRDMGADEAADTAFYAGMGFIPLNPITSEFLGNARSVLDSLKQAGFAKKNDPELRQIPKVEACISKWLSRR